MDVSRSRLVEIIQEWNATRLEMFALSLPDQNLEFYGVMRFYYYENDGNIATKCLRVYSTATVSDVVFALLDKLSSIKIISTHTSYGMCEVHSDGTSRVLDMDELPLLLQLTWMKDCIEGRFLLRQSDNFVPPNYLAKNGSKTGENVPTDDSLLAKDLYSKIPENLFTQSISNHEVVMRRKRHQKLDRKLVQISGVDGSPDKGAPMRIYGTLLNPSVPYKTLLLSYRDTADFVIKEMLGKYLMSDQDPEDFVLVKLSLPPGVTEYSYDDILDALPLSGGDIPYIIRSKHDPSQGLVLFHVVKKEMFSTNVEVAVPCGEQVESDPSLPYIKQLGKKDCHVVFLQTGVTVFGCHPVLSKCTFVEVSGEGILGAHAEMTYDGKVVMIRPFDKAKLLVNDVPVFDSFVLLHGDIIQFGATPPYKIYIPGFVEYSTEFVDKKPSEKSRTPNLVNSYALIPGELIFPGECIIVLLRKSLDISPPDVSFKLGPAFFIYLLTRHYSSLNDPEGAQSFLVNTAASLAEVMKNSTSSPSVLTFWISNCVELLQLLIKDAFIALSSSNILSIFLEACTVGYDELFEIISLDLEMAAKLFFKDTDYSPEESRTTIDKVFDVIGSTVYLMQSNKLHPSIAQMFFGELFDLLNSQIVHTVISTPLYCSHKWGRRLRERLAMLIRFAAIQGLEQSATISLQLSTELATFLCQVEEGIEASQYRQLNSLQVEHILSNFTYSHRSHALSPHKKQEMIHQFIRSVDSLIIQSNSPLLLLREVQKQPFSLPDSGYHYEHIEEIPHEFIDYVADIFGGDDSCRLELNGRQVTVISAEESKPEVDQKRYNAEIGRQIASMNLPADPQVITVRITKLNGTLGISLAAARSQTDGSLIIIVDSIVKDGAAHLNGKVRPFDQLLMVECHSLINVSLSRVTQIMMNSSDCVELRVVKSGALYHLPYRLLKNVSPKFHSLLENNYSRPPSLNDAPRSADLQPVILTPIKQANQSITNRTTETPRKLDLLRNRSGQREDQPGFVSQSERSGQQEGEPGFVRQPGFIRQPERSGQREKAGFARQPGRNAIERSRTPPVRVGGESVQKPIQLIKPSKQSDSFLRKLNSIPPRSDSRFAREGKVRNAAPSPNQEEVVRRPPHRTPPPQRRTKENEISSPHMARVVSTVPMYSNIREMCDKKSDASPARNDQPKSRDNVYGMTHSGPNRVPPQRVSSLGQNLRVNEVNRGGYRPIIKIFEEDDSERTHKSVSFCPEKAMTERQPPRTEDDYSNLYNSASRGEPASRHSVD